MNDLHVSVLAGLDWHALSTHWILTLAHFLWQGAAIGLLAAVAVLISRHSSSRVRHGICLIALSSFIPCLAVTWMMVDVDKYLASSSRPESPANPLTDRTRPFPSSELPDFPSRVDIGETVAETTLSPPPREGSSAEPIPVADPPANAESVLSRIAPAVAAAYLVGVMLLMFRTSLGLWGGRRLRSLSRPVLDPDLLALVERQARKVGLKAAPLVTYCTKVAVPTVIGLLKPVVLLPASLVTNLSTDQLAALLSHEFAHIRRHDLLVNLLQRLIESVLFFHPAVWWISRRISLERENCCDDLASASGFGNLQYAGALLRMAELSLPQRSKQFAAQLAALSAEGSSAAHFSRRIERLLDIPNAPRLAVSRLSAVFAVVLSVLSVGVLARISDREPVTPKAVTTTDEVTADEITADEVDGSIIETENTPVAGTQPGSNALDEQTSAEIQEDTPERPAAPYFEFLKPYPKLYALSLEMTEVQFLTIVHKEKLKLRRNPDGPSYWIPTDDGHIVIVMFGNNGSKCSGVQRIQGGINEEAETPPAIVDSKGIYWSAHVSDGFRVGAKLLAEEGQLTAGERLVVQYVLVNESDEAKSIQLVPSKPVLPALGAENRIELSLFPANAEPRSFEISPGQFLEDPAHRAEIDTTGFLTGQYLVMARNFFWRPDPENPNHKDGFPARVQIPFTIVSKEPGPGESQPAAKTRPDGINWGKPVAGLQLGSRILGDSTLFKPGSAPEIQLFLRNVAKTPRDIEILLPHPLDGWLLNVEDLQGNNILLEKNYIRLFSAQESFQILLAAGETVTLTGVKHRVNEAPKAIKNASFRIEREKPDREFWRGGILVSRGGTYRAVHTVFLKRSDIPGVRLNVSTGKSTFRVSGPELKNNPEKDDEQPPGEDGEAAIRLWNARLVDGLTGKPLPGITVRVQGAITGKTELQPIELVSSGQGMITVPLRDGTLTSVDVQTSGWWSGPYQLIGQRPSNPNQPPQKDGEPVSDPKVPRDIKLWRGDTVTGKLLYPDKSPAGGVLLNVGVYINHMEWKKRLGMDLTFYSFDHGQWPNWSRAIITNDDGSFTTTVPPDDARSWVRVGTTGPAFGVIQPEHVEAESTGKALADCVPFEAELAGNNPGYGYRIVDVQSGPRDDLLNFGTLQLIAGIRVRGRVVDADGNGLEDVGLFTKGRGGRGAWSGKDGRFEFLPIEAGSRTIYTDARLRDAKGKVISGDVQAVFIDQTYPITSEAAELIVQAVPHVEVKFDWIDRRAEKEATASYYGHFKGDFKVVGHYPLQDGERAYWHGETKLIERDGRKLLAVKVPRKLIKPTLVLVQDRAVTASYEDETGKTSGPGRVELGDITKPIRRIIYGDEPRKPE